jgi:hypothetical protein
MRNTNSEFEWTDDTIRELRRLWSEGHSTAESADGWASRRMPSSGRRTVSTCRHARRRSEPAARRVRRMRLAGSPSRGLRIPCRFRAWVKPTFQRQSSASLRRLHRHGVWRSHHGVSVRTRAAGRLGSPAHRHSGSVTIQRPSTCRTATSMHFAPTNLVADATRRMKCCSRNFNKHECEIDVRAAAEATVAARVRRVEARGGPASPALPLPRPSPGGGRDGSSGTNWRSTCQSSDPTGTGAHRHIVTR